MVVPKRAQPFLDFTYVQTFAIGKISKLGYYAVRLSFFLSACNAICKERETERQLQRIYSAVSQFNHMGARDIYLRELFRYMIGK